MVAGTGKIGPLMIMGGPPVQVDGLLPGMSQPIIGCDVWSMIPAPISTDISSTKSVVVRTGTKLEF